MHACIYVRTYKLAYFVKLLLLASFCNCKVLRCFNFCMHWSHF